MCKTRHFKRVALVVGQLYRDCGAAGGSDSCVQEVHFRRAYKSANERVVRVVVQMHGRPDLFHFACAKHNNFICQRHCLDLIVGYINHGGAEFVVQFGYFKAHSNSEFGVEV